MIGVICQNCDTSILVSSEDIIAMVIYCHPDDDRIAFMQFDCYACVSVSNRQLTLDEQIIITRHGYGTLFIDIPYESAVEPLTLDYAIDLAQELDKL